MKYLVSLIVSWIAVVALALGISSSAQAQTRITLLTPDPIKADVDKLVQQFEAKTGDKVQVSYGTGVGTRRTVAEDGALDVTLLFAPFDEALKTGNIDKKTQTVVARLRLAIAVKKGAPKPDISTAAAVKMALLNAKSIASVDPMQGSVGGAALLALDKMGITDQVKPKIKWFSGGGGVQDAVANGEIEIALGPYLSDMRNPGPRRRRGFAARGCDPGRHYGLALHKRSGSKSRPGAFGLSEVQGSRACLGGSEGISGSVSLWAPTPVF